MCMTERLKIINQLFTYILLSIKMINELTRGLYIVIISITRYRDIDRGFVERTISWRPYIVQYHARTHVSRVRCSHTAAAASASDCCRLPCTPSMDWLPLPHVPCGRPIMQCIGSLGWGLGDGSCASGALNYACRKAHCARRTA